MPATRTNRPAITLTSPLTVPEVPVRRMLAVALLAAAPFAGVAAAPASACTGVPCNQICDAWNSKIGQRVFGTPCGLN